MVRGCYLRLLRAWRRRGLRAHGGTASAAESMTCRTVGTGTVCWGRCCSDGASFAGWLVGTETQLTFAFDLEKVEIDKATFLRE